MHLRSGLQQRQQTLRQAQERARMVISAFYSISIRWKCTQFDACSKDWFKVEEEEEDEEEVEEEVPVKPNRKQVSRN